ncbi:MAG: NRDE family protein [Alphaproteobacteria bacterium]
MILRRPGQSWPVLLGANRDEMLDRPSRPPARHWPDRPEIVAGLDELAGGTWLGVNDFGVVAAVMNRVGSLGPAPDARSRGELVLEALEHADARNAAQALRELHAPSYRAFNLLIADNRDAYWLKGLGPEGPKTPALAVVPPGLAMLTARDLNDPTSPRIHTYKPRFDSAPAPDPDAGNWLSWEVLLAARAPPAGSGPEEAMTVVTERGFGTVSSSLLALPSAEHAGDGARPIWRYSNGRPDAAPFASVLPARAPMPEAEPVRH